MRRFSGEPDAVVGLDTYWGLKNPVAENVPHLITYGRSRMRFSEKMRHSLQICLAMI